jgi:hypothetical protein
MSLLSSLFAFRVTKEITFPDLPGHTFTIRKLAPRHLEAASKAAQHRAIGEVKELGVGFIKELRSLSEEKVKEETKKDPLLTYDRITLIDKGLQGWETPDVEYPADEKARMEAIEEIDDEIQVALAREILKLSKPKLFEAQEEQEAAAKNG